MRVQLIAAVRAVLVFTVALGIIYPLAVTGVAQVFFGNKANGSLITRHHQVVGSSLIGQSFTGEQWFHPRPSAAGDGYDAMASAASNLGPTNPELGKVVAERAAHYRLINGLDASTPVPVDAVTASGSGLDPDISVANARLQVRRVAKARGLDPNLVRQIVDAHAEEPLLGIIGTPRVNVLQLNLALAANG